MADIIGSLFGITPSLQDQSRLMQREQNFGLGSLYGQATVNTRAPAARQQAYINKQGAQSALAGELVGRVGGLFGLQDPALKRAQDLEAVLQQTQAELGEAGQDPSVLYPTIQQKLADLGYTKEAMQIGMIGQKAIQEAGLNQAKITNELTQAQKYKAEALKALREDDPAQKLFFELAKKASPKSIALAINNGYDISLLDSPEAVKMSPLAQQLIDAGFVYGSPEFNAEMRKMLDAERTGKSKGTGNVSVNVGIDQSKQAEEAGKALGKKLIDLPTADKAESYVNNALSMIDEGISTGALGPIKQQIAKYSSALGVPIGNVDRASNTEVYKAYLGNVVIPMMAQLGGSDSNEELKKMEAILASDITLEEKSMRRILREAKAAIQRDRQWTEKQQKAGEKGEQIPTRLEQGRKPTRRYNPKTKQFEEIK